LRQTSLALGSHLYGKRVYQALSEFRIRTRAILQVSMWPNRTKTEQQKTVRIQKHTALTDPVLRSDYDEVRTLIAAGADPNEFDDFRMTPLLWAIMRGDIAAVRMLLENGADPNVRSNPSDAPLWSAEDDFGMSEIAALLRSYGATK
jgi:ankyrin repeat protein